MGLLKCVTYNHNGPQTWENKKVRKNQSDAMRRKLNSEITFFPIICLDQSFLFVKKNNSVFPITIFFRDFICTSLSWVLNIKLTENKQNVLQRGGLGYNRNIRNGNLMQA